MSSLAWVRRLLPQGSFLHGVIVLAGGTAVGQALTVLVAPILTRLYGPDEFGIFAVYTALLSITSTIAALRYEQAIPLPDEEQTAAELVGVAAVVVTVGAFVVGVAVWLMGERVATWTNTPGIAPYLWALPLGLLGAGLFQALNLWAVRRKQFSSIAVSKLTQSVSQTVIQTGLGALALGPLGLLLGDVFSRLSAAIQLLYSARGADQKVRLRPTAAGMKTVAYRYRRFPLISASGGILNSAGAQLPSLLMAGFFGAEVAGLFALGQRVIAAPMTLVGTSVAQVYLSEAARAKDKQDGGLHLLFRRVTARLFIVGGVPILLLGAVAPAFFALVFGTAWYTAGTYVQVMAPMFALQFVVSPLSQTLNVLERQDLQWLWDAGRFVLVMGVLLGVRQYDASPLAVVSSYSVAMAAMYLVLLLSIHHQTRSR